MSSPETSETPVAQQSFFYGYIVVAAAIGPLVAGYIFDVTDEYQAAFITAIAICITGLIFNIFLKPPGGR